MICGMLADRPNTNNFTYLTQILEAFTRFKSEKHWTYSKVGLGASMLAIMKD